MYLDRFSMQKQVCQHPCSLYAYYNQQTYNLKQSKLIYPLQSGVAWLQIWHSWKIKNYPMSKQKKFLYVC